MRHVQGIWIVMLILMATSAWAADVTGKWTGSMSLNDSNPDTACANLKQDGAVVTGTMGPSDDKQFPITRGRIEGEQVTIEARPGPSVFRLTLKLEATKLTGEVFEDDRKIGTVSLQKVDK
jgi:hypothetical protein